MMIATCEFPGKHHSREAGVMVRNCAVIALFLARIIVAGFDLGSSEPAALKKGLLDVHQPVALDVHPRIVSGLPQDAGTLRR
jgi:hypothetical protein